MIILDTNVISEIIKKQPDEHVANWLRNQDTSNLANHRHHRRRVVGRNMSHA